MKSLMQCLLIGLVLLGVPALAGASLTAETDRQQLAANESLSLTLRYEGQVMGDPDFSPLKHDFEILSSQRQSHLSFGAGGGGSYTEWVLKLMPKRSGELVVPSLRFRGEVTDAIPLEVREPSAGSSDSEKPVFLEATLDRDSVYVQAQAVVTLRLYTAVRLRNVEIPKLEVPGARVLKLHDTQYRKTLEGREYVVVELKFALFPEQPGTLKIPSLRFTAVIPDGRDPFGSSLFSSGGRALRLASDPLSLEVKPIPEGVDVDDWIPARGVSIGQRWSREPDSLKVGEPITRTLTLTGQGLAGAQLPPLAREGGDGYKRYPDQPAISQSTSASGVVGKRVESAAIVPTRPGELTLPPLTVTWWDTESERLRETTLEAVTLQVAAAPRSDTAPTQGGGTDSAKPASGRDRGDTVWTDILWPPGPLALSLLGNVLLLIAMIGLAVRRRSPKADPETESDDHRIEAQEADAFRSLTRAQTAAQLRRAILNWARLYWKTRNDIHTLARVADLTGDETLRQAFRQLDNALYDREPDCSPDLDTIKDRLKAVRRDRKRTTRGQRNALKPLYS